MGGWVTYADYADAVLALLSLAKDAYNDGCELSADDDDSDEYDGPVTNAGNQPFMPEIDHTTSIGWGADANGPGEVRFYKAGVEVPITPPALSIPPATGQENAGAKVG